jgi:hypothetical protein
MVLIDRTKILQIHLNQLADIAANSEPNARDAIYASVALRCIFEKGLIGRVAKEHGITISVVSPKLDDIPYQNALVFVCGGYRLGSNYTRPFYLYREPGLKSVYRPQFEREIASSPSEYNYQEVKLRDFLASTSVAIIGRIICREAVFRFVAHKCGGAHYHDSIDGFDDLEKAAANVGKILHTTDSGLSALFSETIGTAWFLTNSPSVQRLRAVLGPSQTTVIPLPSRSA